jgi:alkanesulfonate monooxygenase SsuD/methylene tetrahydromethanopterin reductase-like flavin-dependent oxidoreductase (luciferase family)
VRLGVVLEAAALGDLVAQAQAAERAGLDLAWLGGEAPLPAAAALAPATRVLRLIACVPAGQHPLAIAEAAAVADNLTNGRLVLTVAGDDAGVLGETADALVAALAARPFRHAGERWTIPAMRPENDGATERIVVTPPPVQAEMPIWLAGRAGEEAAPARGLPHVVGTDTRTMPTGRVRPTRRTLEAAADGTFDADALVAALRADQAAWGCDVAILAPPPALAPAARRHAIARLATHVRPRVVQVPLPDGLEADWAAELDDRIAALDD